MTGPEARLDKTYILERIRASEPRLRSLGIEAIGLFGSFVRGEADDNSDIDILVEFKAAEKSYDNFIETCFLLEGVFGRKVELVTVESLSPYMKEHILQEVEYATFTN